MSSRIESGQDNQRNEQIELKNRWERLDLEAEQNGLLESATTLTEVGSILYKCGNKLEQDKVFGLAEGEFQVAEWDRIKNILEQWQYVEGEGDEKALTFYNDARTLIEEFPGSQTRRTIDRILRGYLNIA